MNNVRGNHREASRLLYLNEISGRVGPLLIYLPDSNYALMDGQFVKRVD